MSSSVKLLTVSYNGSIRKVYLYPGLSYSEAERMFLTLFGLSGCIVVGLRSLDGELFSLEYATLNPAHLPANLTLMVERAEAATAWSAQSVPVSDRRSYQAAQEARVRAADAYHRGASDHRPATARPQSRSVRLLSSAADYSAALYSSPDRMLIIAILDDSPVSERFLALFDRFSRDARYSHLSFVLLPVDVALDCPLEFSSSGVPSLHFAMFGHVLGQLERPNQQQMEKILDRSEALVREKLQAKQEQESEEESQQSESEAESEAEQSQQSAAAAPSGLAGLLDRSDVELLERLIIRRDPAVQKAFKVLPELQSLLDLLIRLIERVRGQPSNGPAPAPMPSAAQAAVINEQILATCVKEMIGWGLLSAEEGELLAELYSAGHPDLAALLAEYSRGGDESRLVQSLQLVAKRERKNQLEAKLKSLTAQQNALLSQFQRMSQHEQTEEEDADEPESQRSIESEALEHINALEDSDVDGNSPSRYVRILAVLVSAGLISEVEGAEFAQLVYANHPLAVAAMLAFSFNRDLNDFVDTVKRILARHLMQPQAPTDSGEFVDGSAKEDELLYIAEAQFSERSAPSRRPSLAVPPPAAAIAKIVSRQEAEQEQDQDEDLDHTQDSGKSSEAAIGALESLRGSSSDGSIVLMDEILSLVPASTLSNSTQYQQLHELIVDCDPVLFAALQIYKEHAKQAKSEREVKQIQSELGETISRRLEKYFSEPVSKQHQKWRQQQKRRQEEHQRDREQQLKRVQEEEEEGEENENAAKHRRKSSNNEFKQEDIESQLAKMAAERLQATEARSGKSRKGRTPANSIDWSNGGPANKGRTRTPANSIASAAELFTRKELRPAADPAPMAAQPSKDRKHRGRTPANSISGEGDLGAGGAEFLKKLREMTTNNQGKLVDLSQLEQELESGAAAARVAYGEEEDYSDEEAPLEPEIDSEAAKSAEAAMKAAKRARARTPANSVASEAELKSLMGISKETPLAQAFSMSPQQQPHSEAALASAASQLLGSGASSAAVPSGSHKRNRRGRTPANSISNESDIFGDSEEARREFLRTRDLARAAAEAEQKQSEYAAILADATQAMQNAGEFSPEAAALLVSLYEEGDDLLREALEHHKRTGDRQALYLKLKAIAREYAEIIKGKQM